MIQIKHRYTNTVLCEFEVETLKDAVVKAVADGANLRGANLRGVNLYGANLRSADLRSANLRGVNLRSADLRGANLRGVNLYGANLRSADLRSADLRSANLRGANLYGADLYGEKIAIAPITIGGLLWTVCISESYLEIGCQLHTHDEWEAFDDDAISYMHSDALTFWAANKSWLLSACKAHRKESLAVRKANPDKEQEVV